MYLPNFKVVAAENFELCGPIDLNAAKIGHKFAIVPSNMFRILLGEIINHSGHIQAHSLHFANLLRIFKI